MLKPVRMMSFAFALAMLGCACPEKRAEEPGTAPAPVEPGPPPVDPALPGAPPATPTPPPTEPTPAPPAVEPPPAPAPPPAAALPSKAGDKCDEKGCGGGFTCVSYFGIAGAKGPEFKSCEMPCPKATDKCAAGTKCVTIADGPGRVCR